MNAAEQYAHFKLVTEGVFNASSSNNKPWAAVFALFNTAEEIINQSLGVYRKVDTSQAIATDPSDLLYNFPADILGNRVLQSGVQLIYDDNTIETVRRISSDRARGLFGDFTNPTGLTEGAERSWWPSDVDPGQFYLAWPATKSGTLRMSYIARPTHPLSSLNAIYGPTTSPTMDFENGSTAVTVNGTPAKALFALDDADNPLFQVGNGTLAVPPSKWYNVASVTVNGSDQVTALVLEQAYVEATAAGASFVAAQQSDVARQLKSERDGFLPVWFALGTLMRPSDKQQQQDFMAMFNARLLQATPFDPHEEVRSAPVAGSRATFRRTRAG